MTQLSRKTLTYVIALLVIVVAFLLLGGGAWMTGMMHNGRSMDMNDLKWVQIVISLVIGFVLGLLFSRRKWYN